MVAAILMGPLLCVLYGCVGMVGAWIVAVKWLSVDPGVFVANIERYLELKDFWMGMIKAAVFGFLLSAISCNQGFTPAAALAVWAWRPREPWYRARSPCSSRITSSPIG